MFTAKLTYITHECPIEDWRPLDEGVMTLGKTYEVTVSALRFNEKTNQCEVTNDRGERMRILQGHFAPAYDTQTLLKALAAGGYHAHPTKEGFYMMGDFMLPMAPSFVQSDFLIPGGYPEHPGQCECDIKDLMSVGHDKDCCEHPSKKKPPTEK